MNLDFAKSIISGDNGTGSSNRVSLILIVLGLLSWTTYSVIMSPDHSIPDLGSSWYALVAILVGGTAVGKGTEAYKAVKGAEEAPAEETPQ